MQDKIAIIGAGPAGLVAAWRLRALGYEHVKVFERRDRVGGKCLTVEMDGKNYELGAVIVGRTTYTVVNALIEELGLSCMPITKTALLNTQAGGHEPRLSLLRDMLFRYRPALKKFLAQHRGILVPEPGYLGFDAETFGKTFAQWARDHDLEDLQELVAPIYTGFGYGYLDKVSAAQFFKIYDPDRIDKTFAYRPFQKPSMLGIREGFQGLCEALASKLDVQLSTDITDIRRDERVTITHSGVHETFDKVILACPLHRIADVMDLDADEEDLFCRVRTLDYQTITATVRGLGRHNLVFFRDNMTSDRAGHLVCGYQRWPDTQIWALYAQSDGSLDDAAVLERVHQDLHAVGATLTTIHRHDKWDFYPHVSPEDFRQGFYPRLEARQGHRHTYIAGEIVAAASVESVARYSTELIRRFFGHTGA